MCVHGGEPAFVLGILNKLVVKLPEAILEFAASLFCGGLGDLVPRHTAQNLLPHIRDRKI